MIKRIVLGALVLVLVIAGVRSLSGSSKKASQGSEQKVSAHTPLKCTKMMMQGDAGTGELTMYIDGPMYRYDMVLNHKQMGKKEMHGIVKDGKTYAWGSALMIPGLSNGIGIITSEGDTTYTPDIPDVESLKLSEKMGGMKCEPWNPDPSMFALPKTITFRDIEKEGMMGIMGNEMAKGMGGLVAGVPCSYCERMDTKPMKEQCLKTCKKDESKKHE